MRVLSTLSAASTDEEMGVVFSPSVAREKDELGVVRPSMQRLAWRTDRGTWKQFHEQAV